MSQPLELPDTESFLFRGELSHSPFLKVLPRLFRSKLKNPLSAQLENTASKIRKISRKKAWARTQLGAKIFEQETSEGLCVVSTDPSQQWLRWVELF